MSLFKNLQLIQQSTDRPTDKESFNFLMRHLEKVTVASAADGNEGYDQSLRPSPCESVEELLLALQTKHQGFCQQPVIDCLLVGLAVSVSLKVPGPLLWVHYVGPSSSLKTTLAKLIASASDKCFSVSKFNGLYSGYKTPGTDNSLVPRLQGRVLVINDLTPLLQADKGTQDEVFGQLRDIYDGSGGAFYKNGVAPQYDGVIFGCLTCTTDTIRKFSRSDLGERFLMSEINADYDSQGRFRPILTDTTVKGNAFDSVLETIATGLDNNADEPPSLDNLSPERAKCWGLINHLHEWMSDEGHNLAACARAIMADTAFKATVEALADWLEHARCPVPKKNEDISVRVRPALPHRTIKQLTKLAMCLCIVSKSIGLTDNIRRIIRNKAFDTCHGLPLEIMNFLAGHPNYPKELLAVKCHISPTWVAHHCDHMISIGVIEQTHENNGTGKRGRHGACYSLTPKFRAYADTIGLKILKRNEEPVYKPPVGLRALVEGTNSPPTTEKPSLLRRLREGKAS